MSRAWRTACQAWDALTTWLESGDLVPLLVIVSAWHYIDVLRGLDPWPVAVAIGLLVDVGHFRAVIIAARYAGERNGQRALRWAVALVMTVISLAYHLRYYGGDWWFAVPMPLLIAALAYFERNATRKRSAPSDVNPLRAKSSEPASEPSEPASVVQSAPSEPERLQAKFVCSKCGRTFASQNALNAHKCKVTP